MGVGPTLLSANCKDLCHGHSHEQTPTLLGAITTVQLLRFCHCRRAERDVEKVARALELRSIS